MKIIVVALLKPSQINYKIVPLTRSNYVEEVLVIRKVNGPAIDKVNYVVLPWICRITLFYVLLTPFIIAYHAKKRKIDLILSYHFVPHGFFAYLASIISRVPFVYSQIDLDIQNLTKIKLFKAIILQILKKAKAINVPGSKSLNFWIASGIDRAKINILHSTIDTDLGYYPIPMTKEFDFIYVGTMEKRKQLKIIIEAIAILKKEVPNVKFCIVGKGEEENELKLLTKKLDLTNNVIFAGQQSNIIEWLNKSKIFVMASRNEGIPCAMMEAMACELIPIVPDVADIADVVITNETGILIPNISVQTVFNALKEAYFNYSTMQNIKKNARMMIENNHSYKSATIKWNKIFKHLQN